jgi:hypothetical protein
MTESNIGSLVGDLVAMAKAFEELPQVKADLEAERGKSLQQLAHSQALEESIIRYKAEIDQLNQKVRKTEVERDDAEMRFLELDEKAHKVLDLAGTMQAALEKVRAEMAPPIPAPPAEVEAKAEQGQGEALPTPSQSETTAPVDTITSTASPTEQAVSTDDSGQRDPLPTSAQAAPTTTGTESEASDSKPYANRKYHDYPGYVSRWDWINGGGTDESYDYRPF